MAMSEEELFAKRDEFDKRLRQLEDEVSLLEERINTAREKVRKVKTLEDVEAFDNWYANNLLDTELNYITIEGV